MATTKKSSVKKRATTTKRTSVKTRRSTSKSQSRPVRIPAPRSLRLERDRDNFMETKVTDQSIYWIVFGIVVIAFASWILKVQADLQDVYDKIERDSYAVVEKPKK